MSLTAKQKRFCDEYLIDLNATQAAIRAGYSEKTAYRTGADNLRKPQIEEYIAKRQKELSRSTEITQERVIKELALIAFSNNADYAHVVEKKMKAEVDGALVDVLDEDGKPVMYRTVEPVLTEELTEEQKRALAVIKKGRDGLEVKSCDKVKALELLGKHLGIFTDKIEANVNDTTRSELQELLAQRKARGEPDASK
ncbi:MAG TPA: terminase small subunit [Eubacterium sp.]|jgi:phage terminase small subunit|nr:terminase small subunit [Eubacterium sp.]